MELRHVRAFLTVVDERHVGRAAQRLHLSQPTLSRQLAALERDLDAQLFSREHRRLELTPAGRMLASRAADLIDRADDTVRDVRRAQRGEVGHIRLGFVQSATFGILPPLMREFRTSSPDVVLDVRAMTTLTQLPALRSGRLDVGLLRPPDEDDDLETLLISHDTLVAALPVSHHLADRDSIALADLADQDFVFYTRDGPYIHDTVIAHCRAAGFSPRIVQRARDVQTITALVAGGLGVSLLMSPTPRGHETSVVYLPLRDELPGWDLVLAWSEKAAPAVRRFVEVATSLVADEP